MIYVAATVRNKSPPIETHHRFLDVHSLNSISSDVPIMHYDGAAWRKCHVQPPLHAAADCRGVRVVLKYANRRLTPTEVYWTTEVKQDCLRHWDEVEDVEEEEAPEDEPHHRDAAMVARDMVALFRGF